MNKRPKINLDGVFMRRTRQAQSSPKSDIPQQFLRKSDASESAPKLERTEKAIIGTKPVANIMGDPKRKIDLDLSLDDKKKKTKKGNLWRRLRNWRPTKRFFKRLAIVLGILILLLVGFLAYKIFIASGNIFKGGGQSLIGKDGIDKTKLQHEGDGRVNVLLAATSEDDPDHPGGILTDSIMILSIDPVNKGATMVSIPRDLWVDMPNCTLYYQEKINAAYQCGEEIGFNEEGFPAGGMGYLQKIVESTFDLNINYYAKINYTAFRQAVDAVDGIDVTIDSPDPRGILDRNFDWICNYSCYKVKWPNGPVHLDGEHALYLARSRNSAGGYGMPRGDFDRTEYQRKMMISLKEKATSLQTLGNPVKLGALIDSIGNNLVTNFSRDEMIKLYSLAKDIQQDKIKSIGLADGDDAVLTTGNISGASVVLPVAGAGDFSQVQLFVRKNMIDPYVVNEKPTIALFNGSGRAGLATEQKDLLESYGYKVVAVENAPTQDYVKTMFYDRTKGSKEITRQYLQNRYSTTALSDALPEGVSPEYGEAELDENGNPKPRKTADYVIILGSN